MPSYPVNLSIGPKSPPQLASPQPPLFGDLHTTWKRWPKSGVPVSSPGKMPSRLSGPIGSASAGMRSNSSRAPSP